MLLDGNHDWLTDPLAGGLFEASTPPVRTLVKADMSCSSVAAASVLAKVERDAMMVALHEQHPQYGWAGNKGYSAPEHLAALGEHGPCAQHRRSWRLPACEPGAVPRARVREDVDVTPLSQVAW